MNFTWESTMKWLLSTGIRVGAVVLGSLIVLGIVRLVIRARRKGVILERLGAEHMKRKETIARMLENIVRVGVGLAAFFMILHYLGVDMTPLLAGAGIIGLAASFGAQSLVRDVISGFFIVLENNINVGDSVEIAGVSGTVEKVGLRVTVLRDLQGRLHAVPNGSIGTISNLTKGWSRAVIEIDVSYRESVDRVMAVLQGIGDELKRDETCGPLILEPMEMLGVDKFGDSAVTLKLMFKTKPDKQWQVAREFRRRAKMTFDELGIRMPYPHRTLELEGPGFSPPPGTEGAPRS